MKRWLIPFLLFIGLINLAFGQAEGFYKDLFMDGGVNLTSRTYLPAAEALNLSMEFLASGDQALQDQIFIENRNDQNGLLLYPDGAPRYRLIYTNGGSATNHGNSLGEEGRKRIRTFYRNGGSYSGSCAGAFISSVSYMASGIYEPYYHIWPGRTHTTGLAETYTGHFITEDSPLLNYFTFGNDNYINNVYHNGGAYARENLDFRRSTITTASSCSSPSSSSKSESRSESIWKMLSCSNTIRTNLLGWLISLRRCQRTLNVQPLNQTWSSCELESTTFLTHLSAFSLLSIV